MSEMQEIVIRKAFGFVTNADSVDQRSNYFLRTRGVRNTGQDFLAQRDLGTKNRYASMPTGITVTDHFRVIDPTTATEYDVVVGLDASNNLRFFVWDTDPVDATAKWNEVSKKLSCILTGGTSTTPTIGTITDILGAAYSVATDELTGWIAYNATRGNACLIASNGVGDFTTIGTSIGSVSVNVSDATDTTPVVVTTTTHSYNDGDFVKLSGITGNTAANGTWQIYDTTPTTFKLLCSQSSGAYVSGGTSVKGLGWVVSDAITLFRLPAFAWHYNYSNGTVPYTRLNAVEVQQKLNVMYGSRSAVTTAPTMREPFQIQRKVETQNYFYNSGGSPLLVFDFADEFRWFADRQQLTPFYSTTGSVNSTSDLIGEVSVEDGSGNVMMLLRYEWALIASTATIAAQGRALRIKITLTYDGYQESDPIHTAFMAGGGVSDYPDIRFKTFLVNAARMNRRITHINIYGAYANSTVYDAGWAEADADYYLMYSIPLNGVDDYYNPDLGTEAVFPDTTTISTLVQAQYWRVVNTVEYTHAMWSDTAYLRIDYSIVMLAVLLGVTLASRLNHQTDITRTVLTPRYAAKVSRSQGSAVVVDVDDSTLAISLLDGDAVNEDDNFVDRAIDSVGNRLRFYLTSTDVLLGLGVNNTNVCAFKSREVEVIDPYSSVQNLYPCDFFAKKSIVQTPYGLFWAGRNGLYWMPSDGSAIRLINQKWKNFYDGSLYTDDRTNPYITSDYRAAIVGGWDAFYSEVWFHCQVNKDTADGGGSEYLNFRFSPRVDEFTCVRKLNIGSSAAVVAFGNSRTDGSFIIAYGTGLLRYPYLTKDDGTQSLLIYQDDVTSADATASKGIPTKFMLKLGELSDRIMQNVIRACIPDFISGFLTGTRPYLTLEFYANKETTPFDTQTWPLTETADNLRPIQQRGQINELAVEASLDSTSEPNATYLDISALTLLLEKWARVGNL